VRRLLPLPATAPIAMSVLHAMPEAVRAAQGLFDTTGCGARRCGVHPAGEVLLTREDVGRHNAVDKVIGRMLLDGALPATGLGCS
jgi:FdhD protein